MRPKWYASGIKPAGGGSASCSIGADSNVFSCESGNVSVKLHGCATPPIGCGFGISDSKNIFELPPPSASRQIIIVSMAGSVLPSPVSVTAAPVFEPVTVATGEAVEMNPLALPVGGPRGVGQPGGGEVL